MTTASAATPLLTPFAITGMIGRDGPRRGLAAASIAAAVAALRAIVLGVGGRVCEMWLPV